MFHVKTTEICKENIMAKNDNAHSVRLVDSLERDIGL